MAYFYSPKQVKISFAEQEISGFVDGTFLSISLNQPLYTNKRSLDGKSAMLLSNNDSATVSFTLMQGSLGDFFLHNINQDMRNNSLGNLGEGKTHSITVDDGSKTFRISLSMCTPTKFPDINYAPKSEEGSRTWVFHCEAVTFQDYRQKPNETKNLLENLLDTALDFIS